MPLLPIPVSKREVAENEAKLRRIDDAVDRRGPPPEPDAAPLPRERGDDPEMGRAAPEPFGYSPDASMIKRRGLDEAPQFSLVSVDRPPPTDDEIQQARAARPLPTDEEIQAARKPREMHTGKQIVEGLDVPVDPAAKAAGNAAVGDDKPMPVTPLPSPAQPKISVTDQHTENVAKAAADADVNKLQGFGGWSEIQIRKYLQRAYATAPTLAEMASYEPDRFAKIAQNGAALENMVSGPPTKEEQDYFRANGLPIPESVEHHGMLGVAMQKAFVGAGEQLYKAWADVGDLLGRHPGPHAPAEIAAEKSRAGNLDYLKQYMTALEMLPVEGHGSLLAGGVDLVAGFIPAAIELGLAPFAALPTIALHGYGALRLAGADPGWAMGGGLAMGLIGAGLGTRFISGLAGKAAAQDAVRAFASQLQREFTQDFSKLAWTHARSGYLMMAGMNAASEFALMGDKYFGKGQKVDPSEWVQLARRVLVDPLVALPFAAVGATREFYAEKGQMLAAHGDNAVLHTISDLIHSASDPDAAAQVLQQVVTKRRTLRQLETAAGVAADRGGPAFLDLNRAANQHRDSLTLMITAPEFRRAAEKMGVSPEDLQRRILLNGKIGFSDAEILGIPLEAPIRTLAHELKDSIDGMSLHADTPSLDAAKKASKTEAPPELEEWYKKREEEIKKTGGLEAVLPTKKTPEAKPGDKNAETQEAQPLQESPTPAPKKVQSALQDDAVKTVENLPREQLYSSVFKDQTKAAREIFAKEKDPALRVQASNTWERARAAEEARKIAAKEYSKIQADISKRLVGDKARNNAYAGGPMFGQAYDSILGNDPVKLSEALKALPEDALSVDHDDLLKAASHANIDDAPLTDARTVHKALTELQESARVAEDVTYFDGQEHSRGGVIAGFEEALRDRKPPGSSGGLFGWAGEQRAAWHAYKLTHHALLQPYGEWGLHRSFWFLQSRNAEDRLVGRHLELTEAPRALAKLGNEPINPPAGWKAHPDAAPKYRKDAWRVALNIGNEEDAFRFAERSGMTLPEIHDWLDNEVKLTKEEWDHVDSWWKSLKEIMDLHAASKSNMLKAPMVRKTPRTISTPHGDYLGGDAPFGWYEDTLGGPQQEREVRSLGASPHKWANPDPKTLLSQLLDKKSPDTWWDTLKGDTGRLIHDTGFGEFNRDTRNMLGDQRFKDVTIQHLGKDWYDRTVDWFNVVQNGGLSDDAQGRDIMSDLFGVGKRIAASAAFNTNLPILAAQPTHFIVAGSRFGAYDPKLWFKGLGHSVTPGGRAEADANSQVVPFRTDRYRAKMAQLWTEVTGDKTAVGRVIDKSNIPGMILQHQMDIRLTNALWHTFKFQALKEGLSLQDAYRQADLRTDQSMPAISIMDQSALNRSKIWGAFTLVRNFPQAVFNLKAMDRWDTQEEVSARGNVFTGYGGMIGRRLGMTAGLVAGYYLMGHGRSEQEQALDLEHPGLGTAKWLARTAIPESALGNPVMHTLLKAVSEAFMEGEPNLRNIHLFESPMEGLTAGLLRDIHKASTADDWQSALFPAFSAFGRATGLIAPALVRSLEGGYKILQPGDFTWAQGASWLSYGPDRKESNIFGGGK